MMWDKSDEESQQSFTYEVKRDKITSPLLPTYRQSTILMQEIDMANYNFRRFWSNLVLNHKAGNKIHLIIESSISHLPRKLGDDNMILALQKGNKAKEFLVNKFRKETGAELSVELKTFVRGPLYAGDIKGLVDFSQYEYLNLIPIVHNKKRANPLKPKPYMVNFDYFFNGVDTASWVFNKFANYINSAKYSLWRGTIA